jgi:hypothetical protein
MKLGFGYMFFEFEPVAGFLNNLLPKVSNVDKLYKVLALTFCISGLLLALFHFIR